MQEPDCVDIEVFVGVDIAKGDHYACVVTSAGPFAPAPLQGPHRYYGPVRPCAPHRYSPTRSVRCLRFSLSRPKTSAVSIGATGSPVPCQRLR